MKKLTKTELEQRDALVAKLRVARESLDTAVNEFNAKLDDMRNELTPHADAYNELLEEARGFMEDIARERQEAFDERSESWQESDKGVEAAAWISEWENAGLDELDIDYPVDIDIQAEDAAQTLEDLPAAPG
jgi:chromosome segregation ATPase